MKKILTYLLPVLLCFAIGACTDDEPKSSSSSSESNINNKPEVTAPSFDKDLSTSDLASFSIRVRFKTGGDNENNLRAVVHWESYRSKPSKTPSKSELTKQESMRQYGGATYHNTGPKKGMTESIVFDKSHAGYSGCYIYFYVECTNSKGTASSSVRYLKAR